MKTNETEGLGLTFHCMFYSLQAAFIATCIMACNPNAPKKPQTFETTAVEQSIREFKANPTEANKAQVDQALAKMDSEIKELDVRSAQSSGAEKTEADDKRFALREKQAAYSSEFTAAKVEATVSKAGDATKESLQKAGDAVKDAAKSAADAVKPN